MPEVKFKTAFDFGEEVYLKTDVDQFKGIVVSISKDWNGGVTYKVKFCDDWDWYQAVELTSERGEIIPKPAKEED